MSVRLVYFAWVREKIGRSDEMVDLPAEIATAKDLIAWLKARGGEYAAAFEREDVIRVAVDRAHVKPSASIRGAREIALFPPVTGG